MPNSVTESTPGAAVPPRPQTPPLPPIYPGDCPTTIRKIIRHGGCSSVTIPNSWLAKWAAPDASHLVTTDHHNGTITVQPLFPRQPTPPPTEPPPQ